MSQQQAAEPPDYFDGRIGRRAPGGRPPSSTVRLLLALLLMALAIEAYSGLAGILALPPLPGGMPSISGAWQRMVAASGGRSFPQLATARLDVAEQPISARPTAPIAIDRVDDAGAVSYGDRLKITFFENTSVSVRSDAAQDGRTVAVLFPRTDLSGEYTIDEAGGLDIPRLGRVLASGKPTPVLESDLAAIFRRVMGRQSNVQVAIVDRLPVYVIGTVRAAGSFKYLTGMTVLQALAGAGGTDIASGDMSRTIEAIRESGRLRQSKDSLDRLLLRQAVLVAQKANADTIAVPPDFASRLSQNEPDARLRTLVADANATLLADRLTYRQKQELALRQVEVVKLELDAQTLRADQLTDLLGRKQNKLRELETVSGRGNLPQFRITDMQVEIAELEARREDLRVAFAQTKRRLLEAQIAEAMGRLNYASAIQAELSETQRKIDDAGRDSAAAEAVVQALRRSLAESNPTSSSLQLTITRRVRGQMVAAPASVTTALRPGDVVQADFAVLPGSATTETLASSENSPSR